MYALDTNTLIYFFKGMGAVSSHLFSHAPREIFIPTVVIYELETGIAKSNDPAKRTRQLASLLEQTNLLPFDTIEAKTSATIRADLEHRGEPIGSLDTLIAGTALAHNLTLVTHNIREFGRVDGLRIEDWF